MSDKHNARNALLRYPGSKTRALKTILGILRRYFESEGWDAEYREPFFGGGSVGFGLLGRCPQVRRAWFNDRDPAVCSVWESAARRADRLAGRLRDYSPDPDGFFAFRDELRAMAGVADLGDRLEAAFKKVACHRMSRSGYGTKGGLMGGIKQQGEWGVGCRYNADRLAAYISEAERLLGSVATHPDVCSCLDFEQVIRAPGKMVLYLDPPYFKQGPKLYQFSFSEDDHARLASVLRSESRPWLLSYDAHPAIDELYRGWARIEVIGVPYSNNSTRQEEPEYLISNRWEGLPPALGRIGSYGAQFEDVLRN
jgi:DNA adenine methylase